MGNVAKRIDIPLIAALFSSLAFAGEVEIKARGTGVSRDVAIEQALVHAVRQVNGVSIKSQQQTDDSSISSNGKSDITEKIDRQIFLDAKGQVAGYDILNENCANQTCDVELSVRVYQ